MGLLMLLREWDNPPMSNNRAEKQPYQAVLASVKEHMAGSRVGESAAIEADKESITTTVEGVPKT
jgi:hypothetical protein